MSKLYVVMPAYNEQDNIESVVKQWHPVVEKINSIDGWEAQLIIANDGSKDSTYSILEKLSFDYPQLIPLDKLNSGHGATLLHLYRYAIANGANFIFQTDSDGQTNPEEFWPMFEKRNEYDIQIGHRAYRQDGISRVFVTKVLRLIVWLMFHEWVIDANTPFRLMETKKLQAIMTVIPQDYFLCNVAISAIAKKWKYKMRFYTITFKPRQGGVNSINMKRILKIGIKAIRDFYTINKNLRKNNGK